MYLNAFGSPNGDLGNIELQSEQIKNCSSYFFIITNFLHYGTNNE